MELAPRSGDIASCSPSNTTAAGFCAELAPRAGDIASSSFAITPTSSFWSGTSTKNRRDSANPTAAGFWAIKIGEEVRDSSKQFVSDPLQQTHSSGKRQITGQADRGSARCKGRSRQSGVSLASAATDLGIETSAGRGRCRHTSGHAWAKAGGGRRESTDLGMMNSKAHRFTMTGFQPVQAYTHTARCFHFAGQGDVQEFETWHNNE